MKPKSFVRDRVHCTALVLAVALGHLYGQAGDTDPTFTANGTDRCVYSLAIQSDGKVLIGGEFTQVNGINRNGIARLHSNGVVDLTFDPGAGADNSVGDIVVQPDGKILVGGIFSSLNGSGSGLARLNPDGSLDHGFGDLEFPYVSALAYHPSGQIYVAASSKVWRLSENGTFDPTFFVELPRFAPDGQPVFVGDFAIQSDSKILFCGNFGLVNDEFRWRVARLTSNGILDPSFVPETGGSVFEVDVLGLRSDGKTYQAGLALSRMNQDGSLDSEFPVVRSGLGFFDSIAVQSDGKAIVGGNFINVGGRTALVRFNNDGIVDQSFSGIVDGQVEAIVVQSDGRILIGGCFSGVNGEARSGIARLLGDNPVLEAERLRGGKAVARWPAAYTNFVLQGVSSIASTNWAAVSQPPVITNGICYITNTISSGNQFFRLMKP